MTDRAEAIAAILSIEAIEPPEMGGGVFRGMGLSDWEAGVIADAVLAVVGARLVHYEAVIASIEMMAAIPPGALHCRLSRPSDHLKGGEMTPTHAAKIARWCARVKALEEALRQSLNLHSAYSSGFGSQFRESIVRFQALLEGNNVQQVPNS